VRLTHLVDVARLAEGVLVGGVLLNPCSSPNRRKRKKVGLCADAGDIMVCSGGEACVETDRLLECIAGKKDARRRTEGWRRRRGEKLFSFSNQGCVPAIFVSMIKKKEKILI